MLQKYALRLDTVTKRVNRARHDESPDLGAWEWLKTVIETLGRDGMSSDESEVEDESSYPKFRIEYMTKRMPWRKDISSELQILDEERWRDREIVRRRGAKPAPRLRTRNAPKTTRLPPSNLPRAFYNDRWYARLTREEKRDLTTSTTKFEWMTVRAH
jgi:hypothetical protein